MSDLSLRRFHNALRIMNCLDRDELVRGGVLAAGDGPGWHRFRSNPAIFMVRADDETAARLWRLIEGRQLDHARAA